MTRAVIVCTALVLGLTACASAPKKSAPDAPAERTTSAPHAAPTSARKVSPYAPAQEDLGKRGHYVAGGLYAPHIADSAPDITIDVDAIPEPDVIQLPRSRYGNRSPYAVLDKQYTVLADTSGYVETGTASYYGTKFHGRRTSNQEVYDMYAFSAAHRSLPLPSFARVTNLDSGQSVIVRVNDRGPFHHGRLIDLSYAAAVKLGITRRGTGRVEVRALQPDGSQPGTVYASASSTPSRTTAPPAVSALDVAVEARSPVASSALDTLVSAMPVAVAQAGASRTGASPAHVGSSPAAATAGSAPVSPPTDYRFDMQQDGRAMSADEFEAWMRARQVRVATGRAATPIASTPIKSTAIASTPMAQGPQPPAPQPSALASASAGERVTLQVASFAARANADRALSMLREAGIADARLHDGEAAGKAVYRLRVGTDAARIGELSSRIVGLGFGTPQRVRD